MEGKQQFFLRMDVWLYALLAPVFLIFPYWSGLFFAVPTAYSYLYMAIVAVVVALWAIVRKTEIKGFHRLDLLVVLYTGVVTLSIFTFASLELTLTGIAKQYGYLFLYMLVRLMLGAGKGTDSVKWLMGLVAASGALFSLYGILAAGGVIEHAGAVMGDPATGAKRIGSAFEYPNTFASYLAVALLLGLAVQTAAERLASRWVWGTVNTLSMLGLILTYSRGGWLVFFGILLALIVFNAKQMRVRLFLQTLVVLIGSLPALPFFTKFIQESDVSSGMIGAAVLFGLAAGAGLLAGRVSSKLEAIRLPKGVAWAGVAVVLVSGFAVYKLGLLPQAIVERIASINLQSFSVVQRFTFYQDGVRALGDHPLVGAGDHTWETTFYQYQSYPYYTTSPHSVIVDQLMNTGLIGTLLFLAIFVLASWGLWKASRQEQGVRSMMMLALLAGFLELTLHAFIDVDFDYAVMGYLFWLFAAVAASGRPVELAYQTDMNAWNWSPKNRWFWWTGSALALAVAVFGSTYVYAQHHVEASKANLGYPAAALDHLDKALSAAPYLAEARSISVSLHERYYQRSEHEVIRSQIHETLLEIPAVVPESADMLAKAGQSLVDHQKSLEGYELIKQAWQKAPYRIEMAEQHALYGQQFGMALRPDDPERAKLFFQDAVNTYEEVQRRIEGFQDLPPVLHLERPYELTPMLSEAAALSAYYLGDYEKAERWAAQAVQQPDGNSVQLLAVLIASKQKLDRPLEAAEQLMLAQNPDLKARVDLLVAQ